MKKGGKDYLGEVVEREPAENQICEEFSEGENTVNDPISKPFRIIFFVVGFQSLKMVSGSFPLEAVIFAMKGACND